MVRVSAGMLVALLGIFLSGCAAKTKQIVVQDEPYKIGREDVLDVAVWRDADLSRTLPVRPDGFISLPIVGELKAEGLTAPQLASVIREKLTAYVQDPKVTVIVREVNSSRVFVTGEVTRPGTYPLRGRVHLWQAIALAGGFSPFASKDSIRVIRGGEKEAIPVRYSDLINEDDDRVEFVLLPGDTVVVP